ncbi:MAG: Gfo/Idh/MocA family oxidoreductase [Myxococcales bacterium]|nr:Gfo/Idh/MocA family oxidoreductase [Myxococcales bacterium]
MSNHANKGVLLVGFGMWGRHLARNLMEMGVLRAVCESNPAAAVAAMQACPTIPVIADFRDALNLSGVDGVVIATPAVTHYPLAHQALTQNKDVLVEKPLALSVSDGASLVELAERKQKILMVGHLLIYHPAVVKLEELIRKGEMGKLLYVYSNRLNWGKVRREENILWSFAPHDIAIMLRLLGEMPTKVMAHGASYLSPGIMDVTTTHLHFASGVDAHIFVSWLHPYKEQRLVVVGDRQVAVFDDGLKDGKLTLYPHRIDWVDHVPVAHKAVGEPVPLPDLEPLRLECETFLEAMKTRQAPPTDGVSGLSVLSVLSWSQKSLETGVPWERNRVSHDVGPTVFVHPTAVVDVGARIGGGTKVWHFCHVMADATIGRDCVLGQNTFVASRVVVGDRVKIQNNVSLYEGVVLEDEVFCGPAVSFTNVRNPRAHVERKDAYETTRVGRGASLGANSTIRCGVNIGRYAAVGAGAVVTKDVAPHTLVVGNPARPVGWVCKCGEVVSKDCDPAENVVCRRCHCVYLVEEGHLMEATGSDSPAK